MGPFDSYKKAEILARSLKQYQGWTPLQQKNFRLAMEEKNEGKLGSKFAVQARKEIFKNVIQHAELTESIEIPTLFIKQKKGFNRTSWQMKPYKTYLNNLHIKEVPGNNCFFLVGPEPFNKVIKIFLLKK